MKYLIVGLGNPGKQYDGTRHNIGFAAVDRLADKYRLTLRKSLQMKGVLAEGNVANAPCLILKPLTYMNLSGESVAVVMRYYNVDLAHLLVIVDDVAIPLGQTRLRIHSGPGGHNGLKSIEEVLKTDEYARLRLGVGDRSNGDLESHVLGRFSEDERAFIPALLERAVTTVELLIEQGLTRAMDFANAKGPGPSTPSIGM